MSFSLLFILIDNGLQTSVNGDVVHLNHSFSDVCSLMSEVLPFSIYNSKLTNAYCLLPNAFSNTSGIDEKLSFSRLSTSDGATHTACVMSSSV